MEEIKVKVSWNDHNFEGGWASPKVGAVMVTGRTVAELKSNFMSALTFHIEGMLESGEYLPEWLVAGNYGVVYDLDAAALIRYAEEYTSMAAISRASGINMKQLSHYANNIKKPRPAQRQRIVDGLHAIGQRLIAAL